MDTKQKILEILKNIDTRWDYNFRFIQTNTAKTIVENKELISIIVKAADKYKAISEDNDDSKEKGEEDKEKNKEKENNNKNSNNIEEEDSIDNDEVIDKLNLNKLKFTATYNNIEYTVTFSEDAIVNGEEVEGGIIMEYDLKENGIEKHYTSEKIEYDLKIVAPIVLDILNCSGYSNLIEVNENNLSIIDILLRNIKNEDKQGLLNAFINMIECSKELKPVTKKILLKCACQGGNIELFKYFFGQFSNEFYNIKNELMYHAFLGRNPEIIHILEEEGCEVDYRALEGAYKSGDVGLVEYVMNNYDINSIQNIECPTLETKIINLLNIINNPYVALCLIGKYIEDIDLNLLYNYKNKLLRQAIESGHLTMVEFIVKTFNIDINGGLEDIIGKPPIIVFAYKKNIEIVKLLLTDKSLDLNKKFLYYGNYYCDYNDNYHCDHSEEIKFFKLITIPRTPNKYVCGIDVDTELNKKFLYYNDYRCDYNGEIKFFEFITIPKTPSGGICGVDIDIELLKLLFSHPSFDINQKFSCDAGEVIPFRIAINNIELTKIVVSNPNFKVNQEFFYCDFGKITPLRLAVIKGNIDAIKLLLSLPETILDDKALIEASGRNNLEIITLLINHPKMVLDESSSSEILIEAIKSENLKILAFLIYHPKILNFNKIDSGEILKCIATYKNKNIKFVKPILDHPNIDINQHFNIKYEGFTFRSIEDKTILGYAVESKNMKLLQILLSYPNLNINERFRFETKLECSPFELALEKGTPELIKLLLSHPNLDVNQKFIHLDFSKFVDEEGFEKVFTPLEYIIAYLKNKELINFLLRHPQLDVIQKFTINKEEMTPLDVIIKMYNEEENEEIKNEYSDTIIFLLEKLRIREIKKEKDKIKKIAETNQLFKIKLIKYKRNNNNGLSECIRGFGLEETDNKICSIY